MNETLTRNQYISGSTSNGKQQGVGSEIQHSFYERENKTRAGYTFGAGFERAIDKHWSLTADYNYYNFDEKNYHFKNARQGVSLKWDYWGFAFDPATGNMTWPAQIVSMSGPGTSNIINGRKLNAEDEMHSFRIGINYRF